MIAVLPSGDQPANCVHERSFFVSSSASTFLPFPSAPTTQARLVTQLTNCPPSRSLRPSVYPIKKGGTSFCFSASRLIHLRSAIETSTPPVLRSRFHGMRCQSIPKRILPLDVMHI